jgi:hypothetical protein
MGFRAGDDSEVETPETIVEPENDNDTKVRLDAVDEDDDRDGEQDEKVQSREPDDQPRKKDGTWAAKKAERGKDRKAAKAWETERADYDRRFQQMREEQDRTVRQLREEMDRMRQSGQQPAQQGDRYASQLSELDKQIDQELQLIEANPNHPYTRYRQLQDQRSEVIAERKWAQLEAQKSRNAPQPSPYAGRVPIIESEFPWLQDQRYADLGRKAMAYRQHLIHVEGRPDTLETDREALSTIQARFGADYGLARPPAPPSQRTRGIYGAPPSRGMPRQQSGEMPQEVDLGPMANGTGLSPAELAKAVRSAFTGK